MENADVSTQKKPFGQNALLAAVILAAVIGFAIMSYLTYIHYAEKQSFCDISEEVSCDVVTTSIYSEIFGVPISLLGLGYFASVLFLVLAKRKQQNIFPALFLLTLFVLIPSLYFSMMEYFVIKAICVLCDSSKIMMLIIAAASFFMARGVTKIGLNSIMPVLIAGLVAAGVTYFAQTATVAQVDYSDLVQCMNEKGVVYYKSVKCNSCKRQEMLLGEAYKKLNSVECHPEGLNPQPELCLSKQIEKTPTFILEQGGQEITRLEGLQKIKNLAEFAGCPFEK